MSGTCPGCGHLVQFLQRHHMLGALGGKSVGIYVFQCPGCEDYMIEVRTTEQPTSLLGSWPLPGNQPPGPPVPHPLGSDCAEAHRCLGVQAWKAAAAMARRTVQGICIERGAKPAKLAAQIAELAAKQTLHPNLVEWATQVRHFGNEGAHPGDDGLAEVTEADARDAVAFMDQLIEWTYHMPERLQVAKQRSGHP